MQQIKEKKKKKELLFEGKKGINFEMMLLKYF